MFHPVMMPESDEELKLVGGCLTLFHLPFTISMTDDPEAPRLQAPLLAVRAWVFRQGKKSGARERLIYHLKTKYKPL